jgi:hypothetical protein
MPVPQENLFFVEQASCLLLTIMQHLSLTNLITITFFCSILLFLRAFAVRLKKALFANHPKKL